MLATPVLIVNAISPTIFAMIVDRWGWQVSQIVLVAVSASSFLAMEFMARWYDARRRAAHATAA
jgi:sugar phosphate permease